MRKGKGLLADESCMESWSMTVGAATKTGEWMGRERGLLDSRDKSSGFGRDSEVEN